MSVHVINGLKIFTTFDPKPIPSNSFDWSAELENYEPGDNLGYGPTEQDAINSLIEMINEDGEEVSLK